MAAMLSTLCSLLALGASPAPLAQDPIDVEALRAEILVQALELAEWADDEEYETGRNAMFRAVLGYDPDHKDARKALGYRKKKGAWEQGRVKDPKDECEAGVPAEFERRWTEAVDAFEARIVAAYAEGGDAPAVVKKRREALSALLPFGTNDPTLREALGFVLLEEHGIWVLHETATALTRRAELADRVATLLANFDAPVETETLPDAAAIELPWTQAYAQGGMTIASTLDPTESQTLLTTAHLMRQIFPYALPGAGRPSYPEGLYAVEVSERARFFKAHPDTPAAEMDYRIAVNSSWLGDNVLVSGKSPALRKDVVAFQVAGYALSEKFTVWIDDGWAQQGLTSYLANLACGTRLSFWDIRTKDEYGNEVGGARNWLDRVPPSTSGWLLQFAELVEEGQTIQEFGRALTAPTVKMSWKEVVTSHAVSAFLLEARPDDLVALLNQAKRDGSMVLKIEEQLAMPLADLRDLMLRWIEEIEVELPKLAPTTEGEDA